MVPLGVGQHTSRQRELCARTPMKSSQWIAGLAALLAACANAPSSPMAGGIDRTPQSAAADVAWLDRLTWGATPASAQELRRLGRDAWLRRQLQPPPSAALPEAAQAQIDTLTIARTPLPELVRALE